MIMLIQEAVPLPERINLTHPYVSEYHKSDWHCVHLQSSCVRFLLHLINSLCLITTTVCSFLVVFDWFYVRFIQAVVFILFCAHLGLLRAIDKKTCGNNTIILKDFNYVEYRIVENKKYILKYTKYTKKIGSSKLFAGMKLSKKCLSLSLSLS